MDGIGGQEILPRARGSALDAAMVAAAGDHADRRRHVREKVLKAAKIIHGSGDSILNCLVLDESPEGVFVDLGAVVALPAEVTIQYYSGAMFKAVRRWSTGSKVGFQFVGPQIVSHETARRMQMVFDILHRHGLAAAMEALRMAHFFDNAALRRTAETAFAAQQELERFLTGEGKVN